MRVNDIIESFVLKDFYLSIRYKDELMYVGKLDKLYFMDEFLHPFKSKNCSVHMLLDFKINKYSVDFIQRVILIETYI